jgi:hypothetical protein
MNDPPSDCQLPPSSKPASAEPTGLLLSRDLLFTSKITGTANALGFLVRVASADLQARSLLGCYRPRVVFVDLTAGDLTAPQTLVAYQEIAGPESWFVAFGSHVDVEVLAAARKAGCHVVLPRSRFSAELPALMRQYFSQAVTRND